jgi:hypothetical protein
MGSICCPRNFKRSWRCFRGLTFGGAITGILIVRVAGEARCDGVEPFPSRGEIDNGGEYRGIVVEKELHPPQRSQYCVL